MNCTRFVGSRDNARKAAFAGCKQSGPTQRMEAFGSGLAISAANSRAAEGQFAQNEVGRAASCDIAASPSSKADDICS